MKEHYKEEALPNGKRVFVCKSCGRPVSRTSLTAHAKAGCVTKITCPRCGDYAPPAKSGAHLGMFCEDCALAERYGFTG